jgi:hypothetical protein
MKKQIYKTGFLLAAAILLITFTAAAQKVTKEYHKEYSTGKNTTLDISNRYGDVVIHSWDKDQVVIDVVVTIEHPNRDRAEKLLSYIDVRFNESGDLISAKTYIDDRFNFSGWGSRSRRFSIDYNVHMPVGNNLNLANRYGNTDLDELRGLVKLDIKYGNLTATTLTRGNERPLNLLNLAYGKATINEAGWLDLVIRYSGNTEIIRSQALLLDSKYSKLKIGETSSLVGETRYDNLKIQSINNLVLDGGYADITVGLLSKKLKYEGGYGSFSVEQIPAGFESLEIDTRYTGVRLGIDNSATYKLDAKVSYGGLKFDENNFQHQRRIVENNSSETSGIVGKESSPSSTVKVKASYGSVKLY